MTARDDEARLLNWARELADPDWCLSVPKPAKDAIRQLVSVIEAKPRTITTAEELDALPVGSVVLDPLGEAYQRINNADGPALWCAGDIIPSRLIILAATVLYEPQS